MSQNCPYCGTVLPGVCDAFCPECRSELPEQQSPRHSTGGQRAFLGRRFVLALMLILIGVVDFVFFFPVWGGDVFVAGFAFIVIGVPLVSGVALGITGVTGRAESGNKHST